MNAPALQVDMFEVQLGAAVLVQARTVSGIVRILVDGGVTGHPHDWVLGKLGEALEHFEAGSDRRIDLIIGTHYDADHLDGLVPIIEDRSIAIGETWLPPVANDAEIHAVEDEPSDDRLLALQFAREDGDEIFLHYISHKARICQALADLEDDEQSERRSFLEGELGRGPDSDDPRAYFLKHLEDASQRLGATSEAHADHDISEPAGFDADARFGWVEQAITASELRERWARRPTLAHVQRRSLSAIRKATAKDAINATALKAVVTALKARKLPIRSPTARPAGSPGRQQRRASYRPPTRPRTDRFSSCWDHPTDW